MIPHLTKKFSTSCTWAGSKSQFWVKPWGSPRREPSPKSRKQSWWRRLPWWLYLSWAADVFLTAAQTYYPGSPKRVQWEGNATQPWMSVPLRSQSAVRQTSYLTVNSDCCSNWKLCNRQWSLQSGCLQNCERDTCTNGHRFRTPVRLRNKLFSWSTHFFRQVKPDFYS